MKIVCRRSLIKFGKNSLVMTIPKVWADYYKLKSGDKMLVVANKRLVIKPVREEKKP